MKPEETISPFEFNKQILECVVGGVSVLDIPRLNVHTREEARQFILAYGYNLDDPEHREQLWSTHRRAVALIKEMLLDAGETIPESLTDQVHLGELTELLIIASSRKKEDHELQRWACAILRVMHVYVHLRNDLFGAFRDEIQSQILNPIQQAIWLDDQTGQTILGPNSVMGGVHLHKYEIKPFKTTASSVVKLLARPERVALTLLDKLGVRFVTRTVYDSFRVIKFLVDSHLISYSHIMPDQSNNTLFPLNIFLEVMEELKLLDSKGVKSPPEAVERMLKERLDVAKARAHYLEKANEFSGRDYRFVKFINRKLISVMIGDGERMRQFRFFYPYEVQIMDHDTYTRNLSGPMAHDEYKARQRRKARERVLGVLEIARGTPGGAE